MLLEIMDLQTFYFTAEGTVRAVDGVSLQLDRGESLAVVGESGSGKTTLALSIPRLLKQPARIVGGSVNFEGQDLLKMSEEKLSKIRGSRIGMVFQQPQAYLNPVLKTGPQIAETLEAHRDLPNKAAMTQAIRLLKEVGISSPEEIAKRYPFELSGGMAQRVVIAMALTCEPSMIIADEPTSALDATIQVQILETIKRLKERFQTSLLLITHDLSLAGTCDKVAVMYAGKIVENADVNKIFSNPRHPYTQLLIESIPKIKTRTDHLKEIPGQPPRLAHPPTGCRFHPRCPYVMAICKHTEPRLLEELADQWVACYLRSKDR